MPKVYSLEGVIPVVDPSSFVHPDAILIGDVIIGRNCYIGPGASLRGDFGQVIVGDGANIQDQCVLHSFPHRAVVVERNGHVGHGAILHGCTVRENALIGMHAVVMDDADIGANAFVGAMAFVKTGFAVPAGTLATGMPARVVRALTDAEITWKTRGTGEYQELARRCLASLEPAEALTAIEPGRPRLGAREAVPLREHREQNEEH